MKKATLRSKILVSAMVVTGLMGATPALADSYLGALIGPSFVNHNGGTDFDFGGHIGTTLAPAFSVGVYATHQTLSSSTFTSSGETILAFEGNFHPATIDSVYIGGKAGIGFTSTSIFGGSSSENDFVFGPAIGFNVPLLSPSLTIGAEGNVLFLEAENTVTFVNILGTLTLHF
jgi:hypothetical protein